MEIKYPTILRRYVATFIDGIFILTTFILVSFLLRQENDLSVGLRVSLAIIIVFVYEPFFTSKLCTLGQLLTKVRIRRRSDLGRISSPAAYVRMVVKIILGMLSFFTIIFTNNKRAIHDFAADSIVISVE